jgi:hypothetical protein
VRIIYADYCRDPKWVGRSTSKPSPLEGVLFVEVEVLSCELFMRIAYAIRMSGPINFKALALRGRFFGEAEVLSCELFMRIRTNPLILSWL